MKSIIITLRLDEEQDKYQSLTTDYISLKKRQQVFMSWSELNLKQFILSLNETN